MVHIHGCHARTTEGGGETEWILIVAEGATPLPRSAGHNRAQVALITPYSARPPEQEEFVSLEHKLHDDELIGGVRLRGGFCYTIHRKKLLQVKIVTPAINYNKDNQ
jgi:hypothetical protein